MRPVATPRLQDPAPAARVGDHWLALAPALVAGAALYWPVLRLFFAQDDVTFLSRAAGLEPTPWSFARPLSEGIAWRVLYGLFGLWPAPYHVVRLALHLASAALVYRIGLRLLRGRAEAGAAAFLFATSTIGFTVLHWASCIVEAMVTTLALAAFALHLGALARGSQVRAWVAAVVAAAAVLAKENAIGLPVMFALASYLAFPRRQALRMSLPSVSLFAVLALAFLATRAFLPYVQYAEGYALSPNPLAWLGQLGTYLTLCLRFAFHFGEAPATGAAGMVLVPVAIALLAAAIRGERGAPRRPGALGAAWFLVFLLPVLPLTHHATDYYLYLPWTGWCWLIPCAFGRVTARWPRATRAATALAALAAFGGLQWSSVRSREHAQLGPLPADKALRESLLLGNAVAGLRAARVAPGAEIGFVNPYAEEHGSLSGQEPPGAAVHSYIPLEAAMRGGESLRLFVPGARDLGFAVVPPPAWDRAQIFLFDNDGTLTALGSPPTAYRALADLFDQEGERDTGESLRRRAQALQTAPRP